jgi:hypothetical protein
LTLLTIFFCCLWLLMCLWFYRLIARENVWQRRMIAMAAGLGAGLIYLLGSMVVRVMVPQAGPDQTGDGQAQEVRIQGR